MTCCLPTARLLAGHLRVGVEEAHRILHHIPDWWLLGWNPLLEEARWVRDDLAFRRRHDPR